MPISGEVGGGHAPRFLARSCARWWSTPLGSDLPIELGLDEVLTLLGSSVMVPEPLRGALGGDAPWRTWNDDPDARPDVAGRVVDGGWSVSSAAGPVVLGPEELVLLERIDRLGEPVAGDDAARRSLRGAGLLPESAGDGGRDRPKRRAPDIERLDRSAAVDVAGASAGWGPVSDHRAGRVPVYAVWHEDVGPLLALGMLTAAARHHDDGALNDRYEIRRPEIAESVLADLARRPGPALLLCSDYVWSLSANLELARRARAVNPDLVVVHGGPSCPKYEVDAARFLDEHAGIAHVLVRGEGEATFCEMLTELAGRPTDLGRLAEVDGLSFRHPDTGEIVRTPDRARVADLDTLPSPYLTGEFDHIPSSSWNFCMTVETNRGCPYGCTFCDWGAATMSRLRKFDLQRVTAELEWAVGHGAVAVDFADANFGILARDVEIAAHLAELKGRLGSPEAVIYYPAKNTTKHLVKIIELFSQASISTIAAVALQSTDATTLTALERSNISLDAYVAVAADHRRRGHVVQGELLLGAPGQTYDSFRRDLQFMFDHEMFARIWPVQVLPNAPMNDPDYRRRFMIRTDDHTMVVATASFTEEDRARMLRLRTVHTMFEEFGLLRHVLRWLQWDRGIDASEVLDRVLDVVDERPERFPHLSWVVSYFDLMATAPEGWQPFFDDVRRLLAEEYAVVDATALDCVLELNRFLMPEPGRSFPAVLPLAHDYVSYYRSATAELYTTGQSGRPDRPLDRYGPGELVVAGDPLELCRRGLHFSGDSRDLLMMGDFHLGTAAANELWSPLARLLPHLARHLDPGQIDLLLGDRKGPEPQAVSPPAVAVAVGQGRSTA